MLYANIFTYIYPTKQKQMKRFGVISFIATSLVALWVFGLSSTPKPDWDGYVICDEVGYVQKDWDTLIFNRRTYEQLPQVELSKGKPTIDIRGFSTMTVPNDTIKFKIRYYARVSD